MPNIFAYFSKAQDFYITALVSILEALRPNILPRAPAVEAGDGTPAKPHRSISPLAPLPPDANPPSPFTSPAAALPRRLPHFDMHVSRQSDK